MARPTRFLLDAEGPPSLRVEPPLVDGTEVLSRHRRRSPSRNPRRTRVMESGSAGRTAPSSNSLDGRNRGERREGVALGAVEPRYGPAAPPRSRLRRRLTPRARARCRVQEAGAAPREARGRGSGPYRAANPRSASAIIVRRARRNRDVRPRRRLFPCCRTRSDVAPRDGCRQARARSQVDPLRLPRRRNGNQRPTAPDHAALPSGLDSRRRRSARQAARCL